MPESNAAVGTPGSLPELGRRIDAALERLLGEELRGVPEGSAAAVRHAVLGPGKRIRPLLLLGARRAAGGELTRGAVRLACSVELVHAYSLVHDDLPCMDDDMLRRGRPTLHVRFGIPVAVGAGAALMPLAVRTVTTAAGELELGGAAAARLVAILARASGASGMVGGQLRDLQAEGRPVDRDEVEAIHRGKTAALIAAAVRMGAVSAGAASPVEERLARFGRHLGLAFQAVDDILDETADAEQLGKKGGRDRVLGKATYPSVLGLERAEAAVRSFAESARSELEGMGRTELMEDVVSFVVERER